MAFLAATLLPKSEYYFGNKRTFSVLVKANESNKLVKKIPRRTCDKNHKYLSAAWNQQRAKSQ